MSMTAELRTHHYSTPLTLNSVDVTTSLRHLTSCILTGFKTLYLLHY